MEENREREGKKKSLWKSLVTVLAVILFVRFVLPLFLQECDTLVCDLLFSLLAVQLLLGFAFLAVVQLLVPFLDPSFVPFLYC